MSAYVTDAGRFGQYRKGDLMPKLRCFAGFLSMSCEFFRENRGFGEPVENVSLPDKHPACQEGLKADILVTPHILVIKLYSLA